jgi:hypothetical protein
MGWGQATYARGGVLAAVFLARAVRAESGDAGIGYASPAAALQALRAKPDVVFSVEHGWTIASESSAATVWSFAPAGDPSFPSVVKREVVKVGDGLGVSTHILCDAPQSACEKLVAYFKDVDQQMKRGFGKHDR